MLRIVKQPYKAPQNRPGNHEWQFQLSDGRTVNLIGLSAIPGISPVGMINRLDEMGWKHPRILCARRKPGRKSGCGNMRINPSEFGSLASLSDKPRR